MLPKKQKKTKNQSRQLEWREQTKKLKKKGHVSLSLSRADTCQEGVSFPPFETAGMRKTTKKKTQKMKVGHFGD